MKHHPLVIYDGKCNFCESQIRIIRWLDIGGKRLDFVSLHDLNFSGEHSNLDRRELMNAMHIIDVEGCVYAGSEAVKYLFRTLPTLWLLCPLIHIPGTSRFWSFLYKLIAANRYRIAGKRCDNGNCKIQ